MNWQDNVKRIFDALMELHPTGSNPPYRQSLTEICGTLDLTEERKATLKAAASLPLRTEFEKASTQAQWSEALVHAFYEPLRHSANAMSAGISLNSPKFALMGVIDAKVLIDDMLVNYRGLTRGASGPMAEILDFYEADLLPDLLRTQEQLFDVLCRDPAAKMDESGLAAMEAQALKNRESGKSHLMALPLASWPKQALS